MAVDGNPRWLLAAKIWFLGVRSPAALLSTVQIAPDIVNVGGSTSYALTPLHPCPCIRPQVFQLGVLVPIWAVLQPEQAAASAILFFLLFP